MHTKVDDAKTIISKASKVRSNLALDKRWETLELEKRSIPTVVGKKLTNYLRTVVYSKFIQTEAQKVR